MNTEALIPALCELLAKSALILTAAALIQRAWTRASASQRHLIWCAAFCTILLLPLTRSIVPRWELPLVRVTATLPERTPFSELPPIQTAATSDATQRVAARQRWQWPDWRTTATAIWAGGVGLLLAMRLLGSVRLRALRASSKPLRDARIGGIATTIFGEMGIRRRVELRLADTGSVPLTWGTLRPVVMLPAEAIAWSDARLTAALRHEAGHIVRGDHFTRWLAHLACAFYWPNPLVWFAARSLRTAQEQATDDLVLRAGTPPADYAAQLFEVARSLAAQHSLARCAVAMASPSTIERRMLAIVDDRRDRRPLGIRAMLGAVLAVAVTLGFSTAAQLRAEEKKVADESEPAKAPRGPQIMVEAKFIEAGAAVKPKSKSSPLASFLSKSPTPGATSVLAEPQTAAAMKELMALKGVDVLSAPSVVTLSGQRAVIEIIREFRYGTEFEKDGDGWKPTVFETRNVGVTFEIEPVLKSDGSIALLLKPSVVEFLGFIDLDSGAKSPASAKPNAPATDLTAPAGRRVRPVFSERKITTNVTVQPGQTVVLSGIAETDESKDFPRKQPARKLLVFVTASIAKKP